MTALRTLAMLLLSATLATAQPANSWLAAPVEAGGYQVELPFTTVNGKMIVEAILRGDRRRFVFDTGSLTLLSRSMVEQYGFPHQEASTITDANERTEAIDIATIDAIDLGGLTIQNVPAFVLSADQTLLDCFKIDGLIGSNLFVNSVVEVDWRRSVITVSDASQFELTEPLKVNRQNMPFLQLSIGDERATFLFDSGDNGWGGLGPATFKKVKKHLTPGRKMRGIANWSIHGLSDVADLRHYATTNLRFAGRSLPYFRFETANANSLGSRLLTYGVLALDFKNQRWGFRPYEQPPEPDNGELNLLPLPADGRLIVGRISEEVQGVAVGDEVTAIEGLDLAVLSLCDWLTGRIEPQLSGRTATIRTKKGLRTITIHKMK